MVAGQRTKNGTRFLLFIIFRHAMRGKVTIRRVGCVFFVVLCCTTRVIAVAAAIAITRGCLLNLSVRVPR